MYRIVVLPSDSAVVLVGRRQAKLHAGSSGLRPDSDGIGSGRDKVASPDVGTDLLSVECQSVNVSLCVCGPGLGGR